MSKLEEFMVEVYYVTPQGKEVHKDVPILSENQHTAAPAWIELNHDELVGATALKTIARSRHEYEKYKNKKI